MGGRGFRDFVNRNGIPHQRGRDGGVRTEPRVTDDGSGVPRPGIGGTRLYKSRPGVTVTNGGGQNKRWEESGVGM